MFWAPASSLATSKKISPTVAKRPSPAATVVLVTTATVEVVTVEIMAQTPFLFILPFYYIIS